MKLQLKADLEKAIEKWAAQGIEDGNWPDCDFGDTIVRRMVDAAEAVFVAAVEVREYDIRERLLEKTKP